VNHLRPASILLFGGLFAALVVPSCKTGDDDDAVECPRGSKGCRCKSNDICSSGLVCNADGKCEASTGQGGSAGAATGGSSGRANGGRAGTEAFAQGGGAGRGTGGSSADAGAAGDNGTGGSGNATGQAGDGAAAGEAGAPGSGGTGGSGTGGKGGTGGTGGSTGGKGGSAGKAGGGGAGGPPCVPIELTTLSVNAFNMPDSITSFSVATPNLEDMLVDDVVALQLYEYVEGLDFDYSGSDLGTFQLGTGLDANYSTCSRCVVATVDELKWFFATEGTLKFELDSDQMNRNGHGTLRNVVLREATYDPTTYESTLVSGGDCYTIANGDLLVNTEPPPETWTCIPYYYADGSDCDCGCGVADPDCESASSSACEFCYCDPSDDMDCSAVNSSQNQSCNL
jgi:hypothetical protein